MTNPLTALSDLGQSIWLDFVSRDLVAGGGLARMIEEDALKGVTSNPAIFQKSIGAGTDYDEAVAALLAERDRPAGGLYEALAVEDIRAAADVLAPVHEATGGVDGYVSLEVSPHLAHDTEATLAEARRLWRAVDRSNLMVKVPATPEGVPAVEALIAEGVHVNVTLLFSHDAHRAVAEAYTRGLERLAEAGGDVSRVASVASFFVSRIDAAVDAELDDDDLKARTAIANAKVAHANAGEVFSGPRWEALAARGARPQRLLWASTGTKDPALPDTLYVEALIGAGTVNTVPPATLDAFRDHGTARATLGEGLEEARAQLAALAGAGVDLDAVTDRLLDEGVDVFVEAFDGLLATVAEKRLAHLGGGGQAIHLPPALAEHHHAALGDWTRSGNVRRLWARDASLWTGADEAHWLGWLDVERDGPALLPALAAVRGTGVDTVLLIGMGGSSLGPEVLARTFGDVPGHPRLVVIDSTDPAQIRAAEARADPARTLHVVSSKSGGTLEPNILMDHFLARARAALGDDAPRRFVAVTDPGSSLEARAREAGFGHVFHGRPDIGGRYSVLSNFGLVPAAAAGIDVAALVASAARMARSCAASVPPAANPGVSLGLALGLAAEAGRDKLTILAGPGMEPFGAWLEQLVAESTGKGGRAIVPVDGEPPAGPAAYGEDRVFAYLAFADRPGDEGPLAALEAAGHPVIRVTLEGPADLGGEFLRWEIATAVAGAVMGLDPFDQPDVEAAKLAAKALTDAYERDGTLEDDATLLEERGVRVMGAADAPRPASLEAALRDHLARIGPGDYAAILAYVERAGPHEARLTEMRRMMRDARGCATCAGFGPRFLHSTGQAHKGGPDTAVVLQITADVAGDIPVPGRRFGFGVVEAAQARGDLQVLRERGRRTLHLRLGPDVARGLDAVTDALRAACAARAAVPA